MTPGESSEQSNAHTQKFALSDIYEKTEVPSSSSNMESIKSHEEDVHRSVPPTSKGVEREDSSVLEKQNDTDALFGAQEKERTMLSMVTDTGPPNTGHRADAGTELPSGRASEASSVPTYTNMAVRLFLSAYKLNYNLRNKHM